MSEHKNNKNIRHRKKKQAWPSILLLGGGLLLFIVAIFAFYKPSASKADIEGTSAPRLVVNQEKVDLGDVKFNQTVEVVFELTNVGDQTLRFTQAPYIELLEGC